MLEITNITKRYDDLALDHVSFCVKKGSVCGICGPNGAGKSTLLKLLCGLEKPNNGEMKWDGKPFVLNREPKIGAMIEHPAFFPNFTGFENLSLLGDLSGDCSKEDVSRAMASVGLSGKAKVKYRNYSLGMKQRLYFAFAIMRKPKLLLLDEPFSGIDPFALKDFEQMITLLAKSGTTVLVSSHDIREIQQIADMAVFLDHGKAVYINEDAKNADLFTDFFSYVDSKGQAQ